MKEYFISEIDIKKLYHLSDITIKLDSTKRQHLLLTGKNGSGKTSLLLEIVKYLQMVNAELDFKTLEIHSAYSDLSIGYEDLERAKRIQTYRQWFEESNGIWVVLNDYDGLKKACKDGTFIMAYFPAERKAQFLQPDGVENVILPEAYEIDHTAGNILLKYMVHLKTQQAYARNEGAEAVAEKIQQWFDRFESALRILLDEESIHLIYDYKKYNFKIQQEGRESFGFNELSDGYSSVIYMVSDLILRMDKNWLLGEEISHYDYQGIVLIDELETHLHIELQKKIFPFLTEFFPGIQFIVTTHSPYILNSVSNAKAYDLERRVEMDHLSAFSSDDLAEGYFEADAYSEELKKELEQYEELCFKKELTEEEHAKRAELRIKFKNLSAELSGAARERFEDIERRRKAND